MNYQSPKAKASSSQSIFQNPGHELHAPVKGSSPADFLGDSQASQFSFQNDHMALNPPDKFASPPNFGIDQWNQDTHVETPPTRKESH